MENIDEVFNHIEKIHPMLGGFYTLEQIKSLCQVFSGNEKANPISTNQFWADGSQFYQLENELCKQVAETKHDQLLDASVAWLKSEHWKNIEINQMDLAGMILEFAELCKQTNNESHLYILISNET